MNREEQITFITHVARATALKYLTRETCILSTRMVGLILENLIGARTLPIAVSAVAVNAKGAALLDEGKTIEDMGADPEVALLVCRHKGPQADKPGDWWGGHLTMLVDGRYFVDASADQFTFARGGITVDSPIVYDLGDDAMLFLNDEKQLGFRSEDGAAIVYQSELEDLTYRDSHDWENTAAGDRLYEYVATGVEGLWDIFGEAENFSEVPLPALPNAPWKRELDQAELEARDAVAVIELGYTRADLEAMAQREGERETKRAEKHGMVRTDPTHEDSYELTPTLRRALAQHSGVPGAKLRAPHRREP